MAAATSLARQAARLNGKLDDSRVVKALGEAAATNEPELRQMAVFALGFIDGTAATQILRDRVRSDEDRFTRYTAAVALGRRGDAAAEGILREMLSTPDLDKVIEIPSTTEKQNKIEAPPTRSHRGPSDRDPPGLSPAGDLPPPRSRKAHQVRAGQRPQPGPGDPAIRGDGQVAGHAWRQLAV